MHKLLLSLLISASLLPACENKSLKGTTSEATAKKEAVQKEAATTEGNKDVAVQAAEEQLNATAEPPVVVAGAYMVCIPNLPGADCATTNKNGALQDFPLTKVYVTGRDLNWVETTMERKSLGYYHVKLPSNLTGSFAIAMRTDAREVLADWVFDAANPVANIVQDGSFEALREGVLTNAETPYWKTRVPVTGAQCSHNLMEVQDGSNNALGTGDGKLFVDLNSLCTDPAGPNNGILYQEIKIERGHLYQLRFSARTNPNVASGTSSLGFHWGNGAVQQYNMGTLGWHDKKYLATFDIDGFSSVEFWDVAADPNGWGPLLDHVRVYDFGHIP